jgi:hypothetical protein
LYQNAAIEKSTRLTAQSVFRSAFVGQTIEVGPKMFSFPTVNGAALLCELMAEA